MEDQKPLKTRPGMVKPAFPMQEEEYLFKKWERSILALSHYSGIVQNELIWYPGLEEDLNYLKKSFTKDIEELQKIWEEIISFVEQVLHENQ
jgi:hypothetical protein